MIYFKGLENKRFRGILERANVKNCSLNFNYTLRTPNIDWEKETDFLENKFIVEHNDPEKDEAFLNFLNNWKDLIAFAVCSFETYEEICMETEVELVPIISKYTGEVDDIKSFGIHNSSLGEPFIMSMLKRSRNIHGNSISYTNINNFYKFFSSIDTSAWLMGRYGYTFHCKKFNNKRGLFTYKKSKKYYRRYIMNNMIKNGFNIDKEAIIKEDIDEIHYMNLLNWRLFSE